jgi:hypothetical protein
VNRIALVIAVVAVAGAFVYFAIRSTSSPATQPTLAYHPSVGEAAAPPDSALPGAAGSAFGASSSHPMMNAQEQRDMKIKITPEMCTKEGEKINTIAGRAPTDPIVLNIVSYCFRVGNVAWARCIENAKDNDAVKVCSTRFMDW